MPLFDTAQGSYEVFRNHVAERTTPIVPWVGAGCSVQAGLPGWGELRAAITSTVESKARTLSEPDRSEALSRLAAIADERNPWIAFERLRREAGQSTYRESIREALRPSASAPVPAVYTNLWRLRPRAIVTLNLDRLVTKACSAVSAQVPVELFSGFDAGRMMHVQQSVRPFIANLHGVLDDVSTWVFTHSDLRRLLAVSAYMQFVRTLFTANTVLFVGLTVDDLAVGGHLDALKAGGVSDSGTHYWLTSRRDRGTDKWAEDRGIRLIRYDDSAGHEAALAEFFDDLFTFVPQEAEVAAPIVMSTPPPSPAAASPSDLEELRQLLNVEASQLLENGTEEAYSAYREFLEDHDEAVHRAWYVSTRPPRNLLLGFQLLEEVAQGAFGRVFRALGPDDRLVALKLLRQEHRASPEMLQAFRRGVKSMKILSQHSLPGMVRFVGASEIPAFVAMEWIEGASLREAVEAGRVSKWSDLLDIAVQLTTVINAAHRLPERVLHRDLRPSNVMLRGFWNEASPTVVVLDFDLSWHRGALEASVVQTSGFGYLAPEQLERRSGTSTRHAAVDSFGLGMTLFFVSGRRHPIAEQHKHSDWIQAIEAAVVRMGRSRFPALRRRFARLIERATRDEQAERWDVGQILGELTQLRDAEDGEVRSAELLAEGILSGSESLCGYEWDHQGAEAVLRSPGGLVLKVHGDERGGEVKGSFDWATSGSEDRRRVGRWIQDAVRDGEGLLRRAGFRVTSSTSGSELHVLFSLSARKETLAAARGALERARARLTYG